MMPVNGGASISQISFKISSFVLERKSYGFGMTWDRVNEVDFSEKINQISSVALLDLHQPNYLN